MIVSHFDTNSTTLVNQYAILDKVDGVHKIFSVKVI